MVFFIIIKEKSERIKNKNFVKIKGKPLYLYLLNELKNQKVFIDTDSNKIINYCRKNFKNNFVVYKREKKFVKFEEKKNNENSPVIMMIENFLEKYVKNNNEIIVTTHVTSPFLKLKTIKRASKFLKNYEFVHSVTEHKEFTWLKKNKKYLPINFSDKKVKKTQNLNPIIFSNGAFFIFRKREFMKYKNRLGKKNYFYSLSYPESLEIDNHNQLYLAKKI